MYSTRGLDARTDTVNLYLLSYIKPKLNECRPSAASKTTPRTISNFDKSLNCNRAVKVRQHRTKNELYCQKDKTENG